VAEKRNIRDHVNVKPAGETPLQGRSHEDDTRLKAQMLQIIYATKLLIAFCMNNNL
jgi:hypothetical protein